MLSGTDGIEAIPFINVSGIGFDAHIANLFSKTKKRGFLTYIKLILKEINYIPRQYKLEYGSINKKTKAYMISFANASQYGNNAQISPNADIKDGLIEIASKKVLEFINTNMLLEANLMVAQNNLKLMLLLINQ